MIFIEFRKRSQIFQVALSDTVLLWLQMTKECTGGSIMDIVYAAEKPSIAKLLSDHTKRRVSPDEINVTENPDETGSFCIGWQFEKYVLSPNGRIAVDSLNLVE